MVMKKLFMILSLTIGIFFCNSCFTAKKAATPVKQTFTFDYKSHGTNKPNSAGILLPLVRPRYAIRFQYSGSDIFVNFRDAFENDLKELAIDKGYNIQNLYRSFDNMTYQDKKNADVPFE